MRYIEESVKESLHGDSSMTGSDLEALLRTWGQATHDRSKNGELRKSAMALRELGAWQSSLVAEAISTGMSWEEVGAALGISRQAAWARFRHTVNVTGGVSMKDVTSLRVMVKDEMRSLKAEAKNFDSKWREERRSIQEQLRQLDKRRSDDREALMKEIYRRTESLRDQIQQLRPVANAPSEEL
jgi:hypothetical protein